MELRATYTGSRLTIELNDDVNVYLVAFGSVVAFKVTTWDAFPSPGLLPPRTISEWIGSPWAIERRNALRLNEADEGLIDSAKHYVIPCMDDVLEVLAPRLTVSLVGPSPRE